MLFLLRSFLFAINGCWEWRRRLQRDSEVPKSTRTQVRVSSARARGKRPPEVEDPTQLPLVLFIELKNYSFVYKLRAVPEWEQLFFTTVLL
jgi:hypothetical protein